MTTERIDIDPHAPDEASVRRAAEALAAGALVVIPTETVYGIAANAAISESVRRLRAIKGRSASQPFTVHIGRREDYAAFVGDDVSAVGRRFVRKAWPGPLTLIFPVKNPGRAEAHDRLSEEGRAAAYVDHSVGIRWPDHRAVNDILVAAGVPIVASSANRTGEPPPLRPEELGRVLRDQVDLIVDAGPTRYRKGSTVVRLNGTGYRVVRSGVYDERTLARLSTVNILFVCTGNTCRSPMAAGLFSRMAAERMGCDAAELADRGVIVGSAGSFGFNGSSASDHAVDLCHRRGADIGDHRSRSLEPELINPADHIFAMTRSHLEAVLAMAPDAASRTTLLDPNGDIGDPIGGTLDVYEGVADRIQTALEGRIDEVAL